MGGGPLVLGDRKATAWLRQAISERNSDRDSGSAATEHLLAVV
jgi:hypothetical protein